jgi:replicative DNA helicase
MTASAERLPPHNREAEQSVLGSMLRDNTVIAAVVGLGLRWEHFYTDAHQKTFRGITSLYDKGHPADLVTLADWLKEQKYLEDAGGYAYLAELWDAAPTAANAEFYARIVQDKGVVRSLIRASTEILRDAYDQAQPVGDLLEEAERRICALALAGTSGQAVPIKEGLARAAALYDQRHERRGAGGVGVQPGTVLTHWLDLDLLTGGLQPAQLVVVAGRPSSGKTAFAVGLTRNALVEGGVPVYFASLEQSLVELSERLWCLEAGVDSHNYRLAKLTHEEMARMADARSRLSPLPLHVDDQSGQSVATVAATARLLKLRHGIGLVIVDYLQLMVPEGRHANRQEEVAATSRRLKLLAKELEIPVVALSQLNRLSEARVDRRPRLSDLRESGAIENDADLVILLHAPEGEPGGQGQGQGQGLRLAIVDKQRNGPKDDIKLFFRAECMRFETWHPDLQG